MRVRSNLLRFVPGCVAPLAETRLSERECWNFLLANWRKHTMWNQLLGHRLNEHTLKTLNFAEKCAVVYGYKLEDQFDPDADWKPYHAKPDPDARSSSSGDVFKSKELSVKARAVVGQWYTFVEQSRVASTPTSLSTSSMVEYLRCRLSGRVGAKCIDKELPPPIGPSEHSPKLSEGVPMGRWVGVALITWLPHLPILSGWSCSAYIVHHDIF